ncbi:MAG: nitroreductase family protein [Coriobacteriia bacterium]
MREPSFSPPPALNGLPAPVALELLAAVPRRASRRSFTGEPVPEGLLDALEQLATGWRPWNDARCAVVREAPQSLFMGIAGTYGGVSRAPSALAFAGTDDAAAAAGYTGEALVLRATALGLSTCWLAGVFSPKAARRLTSFAPEERVFAVSALGFAVERTTAKERVLSVSARSSRRRPLEDIAPGHGSWPTWARAAVESARLAPSAMNRQPWRFSHLDGDLVVAAEGADLPRAATRLDCGIAMLHAELGAYGEGVTGRWRWRPQPEVAAFTPGDG